MSLLLRLPMSLLFPLIPLPNKEATFKIDFLMYSYKVEFPLIPLPNKEATFAQAI